MKRLSLDRNQIKYLAIIAMLLDHIGMFFLSAGLPEAPFPQILAYSLLRVVGRLTAPIMLFFLVEGFTHTSSRKKYGTRLLIFGLISQIPYALSHYNSLLKLDLNMIITLFLTFLMLLAEENISRPWPKRILVFALIMSTFCCDWGVIGPLMAWLFYKFRNDRSAQIKAFTVICLIQVVSAAVFLGMNGRHWYGELWQAGMFLVIPVLLSYNGRPGSRSPVNKWLFYAFYPLHLLVIWLIRSCI